MVQMVTVLISTIVAQSLTSGYTCRKLVDGDPKEASASVLIQERFVHKDRFLVVNHSVDKTMGTSFGSMEYDMSGCPIVQTQEGFWNDRWNNFTTRYGSKGSEQSINGVIARDASPLTEYRNPTLLWFWKVKPKIGASETVTFLAQNVIKKFKIKFTYEGDDTLEILGRKCVVHRVREVPISAPAEVYTIWWFDDEGMGVKRYHKTTSSEYKYELVAWK